MLAVTDARNDDAQLELRASDADRDRTAAALGNAMAAGRLTSAEYAERLDLVYMAKTLGDLVPLTRDLPAADTSGGAVASTDRARVYGRKGKTDPDGPVIRLVGDARFSKVTVRRGQYNP